MNMHDASRQTTQGALQSLISIATPVGSIRRTKSRLCRISFMQTIYKMDLPGASAHGQLSRQALTKAGNISSKVERTRSRNLENPPPLQHFVLKASSTMELDTRSGHQNKSRSIIPWLPEAPSRPSPHETCETTNTSPQSRRPTFCITHRVFFVKLILKGDKPLDFPLHTFYGPDKSCER